jgi:hypothetical protein
MQATPSALLFIIPVCSAVLLYIRLSAQLASRSLHSEFPDKSPRPIISYVAFLSFGILSVVAGSLGLAACTAEHHGVRHPSLEASEQVVVALIEFERM